MTSIKHFASTGNTSRRYGYTVALAALALAVAVGFGVSIGVAATSRPAIAVTIAGSGKVQVTTTYRRRTSHYTLTKNRTIRVAAGTRVTLVERPLNGAAFGGWSGGGCRPSRASCALTARKTTRIRARFVATATKTTITCRTVTYNGSPQTCSALVTGQGGFKTAVSVVYAGNHTNAGIVTVTATFGGNVSHLRSKASTTFVIARASASMAPSISNLPNPNGAVNGGSFTPAANTPSDGTTTVSSNSTGVCSVDPSSRIVSFVHVGTCSLTAHVAAGANYTAADGTPQTFDVSPKVVTGAVPLIIDTDIITSPDDVGGLATAFALQKLGNANVIATVVNARLSRPVASDSWKCVAAIAQYYKSTNTLLGIDGAINGQNTVSPNFVGPCGQLAAPGTTVAPDSAVSVYRQALASQLDHSVVIAGIGYMENLQALLQSGADQFSSLSGSELVALKVKTLVQMGGCYPTTPEPAVCTTTAANPENNFAGNPGAASYVNQHWPTPIVWSGYEVGNGLYTGQGLGIPSSSPVATAYYDYFKALNNTPFAGHGYDSWDLTTVYNAVRPTDASLVPSALGNNTIDAMGANTWVPNASGTQNYLVLNNGPALESSLNTLLNAAP